MKGVILVLALCRLCLPGDARATDYDAELEKIRGQLAPLEGVAFQEPVDLEKASKYAFLKYRYSSLTADFADFQAAEGALDEAIRKVGPSEDLLLLKANFDFKLHRLARTKDDLQVAPGLADGPGGRALRADLDFQEGRYEAARKGYEEALRKKRTWDNLARLAYLESRTGDVAGAGRLYAEAQGELTAKEMRSYAWVELQKGFRIGLYSINPTINWRRPIVPFAELFGVTGTKVLLPAFNDKLWMRCSNEQWLRIGPFKQITSLPSCRTQDGVDNRPLLFRGHGNSLVHSCVLRRFQYENLIQAESQDVAHVRLDV